MREIKFKVWNTKKKCWVSRRDIGINGYGQIYLGSDLQNYPYQDDYVVMQYTGIQDKNGIEVYEGDIVTNITGDKGVVEYQLRSKGYIPINNYGHCCNDVWESFEVIGNIYENPELLEAT